MGLKFIVEDLHEDITYVVEEQNKSGIRKTYIQGPYMMAEAENGNGRVYSLDEMKSEVARYTKDAIIKRRAIGEMNHPQSTEVNPDRGCHLVTELKQNGNYFSGKSEVLTHLPSGKLLEGYILHNIPLGISTRGLGNINEAKKVSNFRLICLDVVHQPSVENAMLESTMESKEWMVNDNGIIVECFNQAYDQLESGLKTLPKHNKDQYLSEQLMKFINFIKNY